MLSDERNCIKEDNLQKYVYEAKPLRDQHQIKDGWLHPYSAVELQNQLLAVVQ